jgi:hypothetical protein
MDAFKLKETREHADGAMRLLARVAAVGATVLLLSAASAPPTLKVHRTWMPNAYPSSYAIGFPSGLNFCFDPIRANLIYAWRGDYVDLAATVNGKIPRDAAIRGEMFYRSLTTSGFRRGDDADAAPTIRFRAFRLHADIPEFDYEVDGARVRESIRPSPDGATLLRRFEITTQDRGLLYRAAAPVEILIDSGAAKRSGDAVTLPPHSTIVFSHALPRQ